MEAYEHPGFAVREMDVDSSNTLYSLTQSLMP